MSMTFVAAKEAASYIPPDAVRVQVREDDGTIRWKAIHKVDSMDCICFQNGVPIMMKANPGRPKANAHNSSLSPQRVMQTLHTDDNRKKAIASNHIYRQMLKDPYDDAVLALIMKDIAEEAANLKFERKRADSAGKDAINLSLKRVDMLRQLTDMWFKRREQMASRSIDMKSPVFRRLFEYFISSFCECMEEAGIDGSTVSNVTLELSRKIKDDPSWEDGAKEAMRNV